MPVAGGGGSYLAWPLFLAKMPYAGLSAGCVVTFPCPPGVTHTLQIPLGIVKGDVDKALAGSAHVISGTLGLGGQKHMWVVYISLSMSARTSHSHSHVHTPPAMQPPSHAPCHAPRSLPHTLPATHLDFFVPPDVCMRRPSRQPPPALAPTVHQVHGVPERCRPDG